jgi:DNA invertase Pin-like site-specific DNA recombinase
MMDRCYREAAKNFHCYGGRGIKVCPERHSIEEFEKWAKGTGFVQGMTLERKNVNGDYCPDNCTWATKKQQANNRRSTVKIECNGESHTVSEWASILDISRSTINNRYRRGMPVEQVLAKGDLRCHA